MGAPPHEVSVLEVPPIRIDAPSALLGFFLALRLQGYDPHVVETADGWVVEVAADTPREQVLDCVRRWLDDESLDRVVVNFAGESRTVRRA